MFSVCIDVFDNDSVGRATKMFSDRVRKFGCYDKIAKRSRAAIVEGLWDAMEGFDMKPDSMLDRYAIVSEIFQGCLPAFFAAVEGDKNEWLVMLLNVSSQTMLKNALIDFVFHLKTEGVKDYE
jgi:hypothetical protein